MTLISHSDWPLPFEVLPWPLTLLVSLFYYTPWRPAHILWAVVRFFVSFFFFFTRCQHPLCFYVVLMFTLSYYQVYPVLETPAEDKDNIASLKHVKAQESRRWQESNACFLKQLYFLLVLFNNKIWYLLHAAMPHLAHTCMICLCVLQMFLSLPVSWDETRLENFSIGTTIWICPEVDWGFWCH